MDARMTVKAYEEGKDEVVDYINKHSLRYTEAQEWLIEKTMSLPNRRMLGSGEELLLLANICNVIGAKKTLDIGVFTGYSALTIATALPDDGKVYAFDITEEYLKDFCEPAWEMGGVREKINFVAGSALETLRKLTEDGHSETFDFAFIDADKPNYKNYFEACMKLIRRKGVIAIDNVLWGRKVLDKDDDSEDTSAIKQFNDDLTNDNRCNISMLNIGDGLTLAFKK